MDTALLSTMFLDAHLLDVDFSDWDQCIRIIVVATELPADERNRLPVYSVELVQVHEINFSFSHFEHPLKDGHYQWRIHNFNMRKEGGRWHLDLSSSRLFPRMTLSCEDVAIRSVDHDALSRILPEWNRPGGPLIRPGIEHMIRYHSISQGRPSRSTRKNR